MNFHPIKLIFLVMIVTTSFDSSSQLIFGFDPSFGAGGKVISSPGIADDYGLSSVIQPDGKIVVVGSTVQGTDTDFVLFRYETNGAPDLSFGIGGMVLTDFNGFDDGAQSVVLQNDGKIVVGGVSSSAAGPDFAVARYNSNGTLDPTFSGDGKAMVDFAGDWDYGISIALQADGKIVLGGYSYDIFLDYDFALVRFTSAGLLDNTFSGDGKTTTDFGNYQDYISEIVIQPDGKIIAAGFGLSSVTFFEDFCIARYNVSGSLDASFGTGGKIMTEVDPSEDDCWALALQPDGKILVGGYSDTNPDGNMALLRYDTNGTLDPTFDSDGIALLTILGLAPAAQKIVVKSDGKILVSGEIFNGTDSDFLLVQLNADGTFDTSFDTDGIYTCVIGTDDEAALDIDLQTDGKIVATGYTKTGTYKDIVVARFMVGFVGYENRCPENQFSVSPNPSSGTFTITGNEPFNNVTVQIFNTTGQLVYFEKNITEDKVQININKLDQGIYHIQLSDETEIPLGFSRLIIE